jgi:RNase adaptor protein for sRNA GlmZ degradation
MGSAKTPQYPIRSLRQRLDPLKMTPQEVLDTSVAQLETLAAFMREQLGKGDDDPRRITTETHACDEILGTLSALILRVRARELH